MRAKTAIVIGLAAVTLGGAKVRGQDQTVLLGGTLIDGRGGAPLEDAVVVMDGPRFGAVGRRGEVEIPTGARQIDAAGKFILPGLMDANVHLFSHINWSRIEFLARYEGRYEDIIEEGAQVALKHGLTTVFDSMGPLQPLMKVRDRLNRGEISGSRLFVAGNIVGFRAVFPAGAEPWATAPFMNRVNAMFEENVGMDLLWMTPEQVREEIRTYVSRGIDFLKYGLSGDGAPVDSTVGQASVLRFSPEAQTAIVEECHRAGITVQTHTVSVESLRLAIEAGVDLLQHCSITGPTPMPESTLRMILDRNIYCGIQTSTRRRRELEMDRGSGSRMSSAYRRSRLEVQHENELRLIEAGVPLLLATDAGVIDPDVYESTEPDRRVDWANVLGEGHFLWLRAMVEKGLKPMDAILAATRNIAAAYQKLDDIGTVEKGKLADLVILTADPLQDIENVRKIWMVIKEGHVIDRDAMPIKKVLTVPRHF